VKRDWTVATTAVAVLAQGRILSPCRFEKAFDKILLTVRHWHSLTMERRASNLHRDEITAKWGTTAGNRRARYYQLTATGRKQLAVEKSQFERVIEAIHRVIEAV